MSVKKYLIYIVAFLLSGHAAAQSAAQLYELGMEQYKAGSYYGAIDEFTKAIEQDSLLQRAYMNRGVAYAQVKNYQASIADFTQVIAFEPNKTAAYKNRALSKESMADYVGAIADYRAMLKINASNTFALEQLTLLENKRKQEAVKPVQPIAVLVIDTVLLEFEDVETATSEKEYVFKAGRVMDVPVPKQLSLTASDASYTQALAKEKAGNYRGAFDDYTKLIEANPDYAPAYNRRGLLKAKYSSYVFDMNLQSSTNSYAQKLHDAETNAELLKGNYGAIEDYTKAIQLDGKLCEAIYNRGLSLYNLKEYPLAIFDFDKAIECNPQYAAAYYYRGLIKALLLDRSGACLDFTQASKFGYAEANTVLEDCK